MIPRLCLILLLLTLPLRAQAEEVTTIFMGSYRVTVPDGHALSNPDFPPVPVLEIGQQINRVNAAGQEDFSIPGADGMRIGLFRLPILQTGADVPSLFGQFIRIDAPLAPGSTTHQLAIDDVYWRAAVSGEVRKLNSIRPGKTWWAVPEAQEISLYLDLSVPSARACRGFAKEAVCVHRFLPQDIRWRRVLELANDSPEMSETSTALLLTRAEMQIPLALLQSLTQTDAYRPCCRPLP